MKNIKALPKASGIYLVRNTIINHYYVGQSKNIYTRFNRHHIYDYKNPSGECYDTKFYKTLRKYGLESFEVSVLELCPEEELDEKEVYYIKVYDSFHHGYNSTEGGQNWSPKIYSPETEEKRRSTREKNQSLKSENHPRARLSNQEVWDIRQRYKDGEGLDSIYQDFKDKYPSKAVFGRIVRGESYVSVGNIPNKSECLAAGRHFSYQDIINIRTLYYLENKGQTELAKQYNVSNTVIKDIVHRITYKDVQDNLPNLRKRQTYRLTPQQVKEIRDKANKGTSVLDLMTEYQIGESAIRKCIKKETYKDIE